MVMLQKNPENIFKYLYLIGYVVIVLWAFLLIFQNNSTKIVFIKNCQNEKCRIIPSFGAPLWMEGIAFAYNRLCHGPP